MPLERPSEFYRDGVYRHAGPQVRHTATAEAPRILNRGGADACTGHRSQYRNFQPRERDSLEAAAVREPGATRPGVGGPRKRDAQEHALARRLSRLADAEHDVRGPVA